MAIRHTEKPKSLKAVVDYKSPKSQHAYSVWGSSDKNEILLYVAAIMPQFDSTIDATTGEVIQLFPHHIDADEFDVGYWDIVVYYENTFDTVDVTLSLGVQSVKIFEALEHIVTYSCLDTQIGDGGDIPDFGTAIGVNGDEVEGCEIEVGKVEFSITRKWQTGILDPGYIKLLMDYTDRTVVNDDVFTFNWLGQEFNFTKGTVRMRGAPHKWSSTGELEVSYHFAYQRSITLADNFRIGGSARIEKEGWHYGWVAYRTIVSNGQMIKQPLAYVVDRVYPYADFGELQLS